MVLEGEVDWVIEGRKDSPAHGVTGDFIYISAMTFHQIFPKSEGTTIRLGMSLPDTGDNFTNGLSARPR